MARITHLPHRHAATWSRVASPITCVFASCPELILGRPRTRHGPRVDTNDSHDTPPECRTLTDQVRGFTGWRMISGEGIGRGLQAGAVLEGYYTVSQKYEVNCLTETQALKLFSFHSLRKEEPTEKLLELSKKIVQITGKLPLAAEVFGSHMYDKKEDEWLTELEKLENTQPGDLQSFLALSFKSLGDEEKTVFLDIACLFLKMEITKEEVMDVLKGCGLYAEAALTVPRQKFLVKILSDKEKYWNNIHPRNCIIDFKKKFVRHATEVEIASSNLENNQGISSAVSYVKNMFVKFPEEEKTRTSEVTIPIEPFAPMKKLRLLQINHVELEGDLKLLPSELKEWNKKSPDSMEDENLKVVNMRGCHSLEAIPDLSNHKALEKLVFEGCKLLLKVPKSVGNLSKLLQQDFSYCTNLTEFLVDVSKLKHLEKLFLSGCSNLSVSASAAAAAAAAASMRTVVVRFADADAAAAAYYIATADFIDVSRRTRRSDAACIQELPECVGRLTSLEELDLSDTALKVLPSSIGDLMMHCTSLTEIPDTINKLISLKEFIINGSGVEELPLNLGSLQSLTEFSAGG
ncbi:hypothetical protein F2Q69_00011401 [Brassica cretica]|uniref:Disease resistance protein Roq1-like winged-helix domain-containing protein n=1 Tax=Brassica cretica TaxID=69181 RepID=A0A8S9QRE6_BRACR|nr:hypothetical protein F2Q69_00011401 [Brassica cretica]